MEDAVINVRGLKVDVRMGVEEMRKKVARPRWLKLCRPYN